jgi:Na+(H+)/acetate symporter ActP
LAPHGADGGILKGFPYWAGVVVVGAVITLNVALGGMKGITLVQAFQYWAKMFAISVPVFVLMAVHGHYGRHLEANASGPAVATVSAPAGLAGGSADGSSRTDPDGVHRAPLPAKAPADPAWLNPFGPLTSKAAKAAKLDQEASRPYALLYTYSLIIALVCGTAGLPHILVRFYTNPDGVAAKRTTMWVMILIGVFYVFPPVFGAMGRNLLPALYEGSGAKGTDKIVLELPKALDTVLGGSGSPPWGSILSGMTCAGAFAAFMSTFSGLLVSMTGALAHDVYGRILRPQSTAQERMRMFKWCAVLLGAVSTLLGCFVEQLQINFMVGQAFAIAAASYFPLLFMSVWWRGMTMAGAATGMLTGGICALLTVALTNFSDLNWLPLAGFWAAHPLLRILCEQPAIWCVPMAIGLMVAVSRLTAATVPSDIRMKMLVLHAPEALGLRQEYIRDHEGH